MGYLVDLTREFYLMQVKLRRRNEEGFRKRQVSLIQMPYKDLSSFLLLVVEISLVRNISEQNIVFSHV